MWKHLAYLKRLAMSVHMVGSETKAAYHLLKSQMEKLLHEKANKGTMYVVVVSSCWD